MAVHSKSGDQGQASLDVVATSPGSAKESGGEAGVRNNDPKTDPGSTRSLLDLPPELRNRIHRYVLAKGQPIYPQQPSDRAEECAAMNLLQASRQTRDEAVGIYSGLNNFHFREGCFAYNFISPIFEFIRSFDRRGLASVETITFESTKAKHSDGRAPSDPRCVGCGSVYVVKVTLACRTARILLGDGCCPNLGYLPADMPIRYIQDAITDALAFRGIERPNLEVGLTPLDICERARKRSAR